EVERIRLAEAVKNSKALATAIAMRDELAALWARSSDSREQLLKQLQAWCRWWSSATACAATPESPSLPRKREPTKKPASSGLFLCGQRPDYLILPSLYMTCFLAFGSYFIISIFSGLVRLFFVVV